MDPKRWREVERIFDRAQALPTRERSAYLAEACSGDPSLRYEVDMLLKQAKSEAGVPTPDQTWATSPGGDLATPDLAGRQFGVYRLTSLLDAGSMGEVYRAHDEQGLDESGGIRVDDVKVRLRCH